MTVEVGPAQIALASPNWAEATVVGVTREAQLLIMSDDHGQKMIAIGRC